MKIKTENSQFYKRNPCKRILEKFKFCSKMWWDNFTKENFEEKVLKLSKILSKKLRGGSILKYNSLETNFTILD